MKNTVVILLVIFVLGGIGMLAVKSKGAPKLMETEIVEKGVEEESMEIEEVFQETETMEKEDVMDKEEGSMMEERERYVVYTPEVFEAAAKTRRVIYFYANWCSTCRPADKSFMEGMDRIPEGVTVVRVNYNDTDTDKLEKDLAKKYGITYQHTFVEVDEKGEVVMVWNGGGLDELLVKIQ